MTAHPARVPRPPAAGRDPQAHDRIAGLLNAARGGDRASLNAIVAELTPLVWHTARAAGLQHHAAEDAVQTVWLRLLEHLDTIENPRALSAWLIVVTRREAWRLSGLSRRDDPLDERVAATRADPAPTPDHHAELDERRRRLWGAVGRLGDDCRLLLRLAAFAPRIPLAVVSDALGRPPGAIGPTRKRCLDKLRHLLEADPEGGWR